MKKSLLSTLLFVATLAFITACDQPMDELKVNATARVTDQATTIKLPLLEISATGCGYGFTIHVMWGTANPYVGNIPYIIKTMSNVTVDSGIVQNGQNTNWVLAPCTTYKVILTLFQVQTVTATTDGCNNLFLC